MDGLYALVEVIEILLKYLGQHHASENKGGGNFKILINVFRLVHLWRHTNDDFEFKKSKKGEECSYCRS